ncbi:MAG TPA: rod-binding protein [Planctomycetota bacterium]|nr:rod-binding protein [Planctomycetota bacterium]
MQVGIDTQIAQTAATAQAAELGKKAAALAASSKGDPKAAEVPQQFSKLLATMLVKEMRRALPEGFFGEGAGADIFDGWLDEHMGSALAARDGLRLEGMIAHSMQSKLDVAPAAPAAQEKIR